VPKKPSPVLNSPPFPPLQWALYSWEGEVTLKSWSGYRLGREKPSTGAARLDVAPPGGADRATPSPEQAAAFEHLLADEKLVHDAVLQAIFRYYPGECLYDEEDEPPEIRKPQQLRNKISLGAAYVLDVTRDGAAYVGLDFDCAWDREHGCGVMTHLGRVTAVGQSPTSFEAWIARRDLERKKG
jgi:Domain of unknown function (DUF6985)